MSAPVGATRSSDRSLAENIVERVDALVGEAEQAAKPLEIDPWRTRLFELFVTAEAAGLVANDADPDLSADGLCQALSERWGLKTAAEQTFRAQAKLPPEQLAQMRRLWSVMRMWMEWTYAWQRWDEFHGEGRR